MPEMVRRLEISVGWETLLADLNRRLEVGDSHEMVVILETVACVECVESIFRTVQLSARKLLQTVIEMFKCFSNT